MQDKNTFTTEMKKIEKDRSHALIKAREESKKI